MELAHRFEQLGLSKAKALETANNKKLSANLDSVISAVKSIDAAKGTFLYYLASNITKNSLPNMVYIAQAIDSRKLTSNDQIAAAIRYCDSTNSVIESDFDKASGVGVVFTAQQIYDGVAILLASKASELQGKRYTLYGALLASLKTSLRWAHPGSVKQELDRQLLELLGPKDERDAPKLKKKDPEQAAPVVKQEPTISMNERAKSIKFVFEGDLSRLHKVGGNLQINDSLMKEHLKRTGGKVITRFPPEPNGFLHIGHAKAINVNFAYAAAHGGITYLRYDDTNPEAEEGRYFDSILDSVRWLGCEPTAITYSSDHFQKLYDLAVELTRRDKAYICHCTPEEIFECRGGESKGARMACIHRNRPIEESLAEFQKMKDGKYKEGEAILRMKMDLDNPNPQFWDLVAYRVLYTPHHRTKSEWCIYPTYDYTHCLCDSFEDITHSMCTTEFILSRESYYWLVDALEIYKPIQWEYGRLKLTNTVLSKRKLNKLVTGNHVSGWDDPRLHTLDALRRRGFTPEAINAFVREIGVTTANSTIEMSKLENYVRDHLNEISPRLFAIIDPLRVTITNLPWGHIEELVIPNKPKDDKMGTRIVPFSKVIYIDASDFRETADPNYFRLSIGKTVGLLNYPFPITCQEAVKSSTGEILEIKCVAEMNESFVKPKTYIQWVAQSAKHQSPVEIEIRMYSDLFYHSDPDNKDQCPNGWLSDVNPNSLIVKKGMVDIGVRNSKIEDKYQFLRVGYFCVDKDSDFETGKYVFNRTVSLKEDNKKD